MLVDKQLFQQLQSSRDFGSAVVLGLVPGVSADVKFGHCPNVVADVVSDVWELGATIPIYIYPSRAGEAMQVAGDAADTHDIAIVGLDENGLTKVEKVTLTGAVNVALAGLWSAVQRMYNNSGTLSVGPVNVTDAATGLKVYASYSADDQQTSQAIYRVPADKIAVVNNVSTAANKEQSQDFSTIFRFASANPDKVFRTQIRYGLQKSGTTNISSDLVVPPPFAPGVDLKMSAQPTAGPADCSAEFSMLLFDTELFEPAFLAELLDG